MTLINDVTTDGFEAEVLNSELPVLVDFHAQWCGPCKTMAPTLEDLAKEYAGEVRIVKVDIDAAPELASKYEVRGVPTFMLIHHGEAKERYTGPQTRGKLAAVFARYMGEAE